MSRIASAWVFSLMGYDESRHSSLLVNLPGCLERIVNELTELSYSTGQTGLLALNAAIEAARIGNAGKSIAGLAHEIRKLSISLEILNDGLRDIIRIMRAVITEVDSAPDGVTAETVGLILPAILHDFDGDLRAGISSLKQDLTAELAPIFNQLDAADPGQYVPGDYTEKINHFCSMVSHMAGGITVFNSRLAGYAASSNLHGFQVREPVQTVQQSAN